MKEFGDKEMAFVTDAFSDIPGETGVASDVDSVVMAELLFN